MSITSYGYQDEIASTGAQWAQHQQILAAPYACADTTAGLVASTAGGVSVGAGVIGGQGILDTVGAGTTYTWDGEPDTGTTWWMICAHRDWSTPATTITAISAGTSGTTLPARDQTPGTVDDQPLALIPWTHGQSAPGTPVDLRVISGGRVGFFLAMSELAMQYFNQLGTQLRIGSTTWWRDLSGTGIPQWTRDPGWKGLINTGGAVTVSATGANGFAATYGGNRLCTGLLVGNQVQLNLNLRHTSGDVTFSSNGGLVDLAICTLGNSSFWPDASVWCRAQIISSDNATYGADLRLDPDGTVWLISGPVNKTIMIDAIRVVVSGNFVFLKSGV